MKKISVMEFFGEPLNYGGQEAFIINMYRNFSSNMKITFVTPFEVTNSKLVDLAEKKKDNIIGDNKCFNSKLRKKFIIETAKKHISSEYDVIHIHSGSLFTLYVCSKIAKKVGIKKVIVHSHSAGKRGLKNKILKFCFRNIKKNADLFFACSKEAAEGKYTNEIINSNRFYIIKNGIDLDIYKFDEKKRIEYRKKFNVEDKIVLINIGRFSYEKNQGFLIDIFKQFKKINDNSHLFIVGGIGTELDNIRKKIKNESLESNVTILVNRSDVNNLLFMSDIFVLPSLWEGLPITGIEAQATGMPSLFSSNVTDEINVSNSFYEMSLEQSAEDWAKKINKLCSIKRQDNIDMIKSKGFDCKETAQKIEKEYFK